MQYQKYNGKSHVLNMARTFEPTGRETIEEYRLLLGEVRAQLARHQVARKRLSRICGIPDAEYQYFVRLLKARDTFFRKTADLIEIARRAGVHETMVRRFETLVQTPKLTMAERLLMDHPAKELTAPRPADL